MTLFLCLLLMANPSDDEAGLRPDTLVEVFPLAVGKQWTYRYFTFWQQNSGSGLQTISDSGRATYEIVNAFYTSDSVRWSFLRRRDLLHRHEINTWDTTYAVRDSLTFEIIERLDGRRPLYRNEDPGPIHLDVFPFTRDFTDTTRIYRYREVGAGDTTMFKSAIPQGFPNPFFRSLFTYKKANGQMRFQYNSGTLDLYDSAHHYLLSSTIVSAREVIATPEGFVLF